MIPISTTEETRILGANFGVFVKVEIESTGSTGTYNDLTALAGRNWVHSVSVSDDEDNLVARADVRLARGSSSGDSLAPLRADSTLSTVVAVARELKVSIATPVAGTTPGSTDYHPVFAGDIDRWAAHDDPMVVQCRDRGGRLMDRWIESDVTHGSSSGDAIETVMQAILSSALEGDNPPTLYTPVSPGFAILSYVQGKMPIMRSLQVLSELIGWQCRYRWRASSTDFELTLYEPGRATVTPDSTFGGGRYAMLPQLEVDVMDIRNVVSVVYPSATSTSSTSDNPRPVPLKVTATDSTSIGKYKRRWMQITEPEESPIDTNTEAQALADAALADLHEPDADQRVDMHVWWPAEVGDLYRWQANSVHYSADQDLAVAGWRHELSEGKHRTHFSVRGKPRMGVKRWLDKEYRKDYPEIITLGFRPSTDMFAIVQATASLGTKEIFVAVGNDVEPFDPDGSTNHGTITGHVGEVLTTVAVTAGNDAHVKAVASNEDGALGPVAYQIFLVVEDPTKLAWWIDPEQPDSTGEAQVVVYDPDLQSVNLEWKKRENKGPWDAAWTTTFDDSSGTIGASTILRWTEDVGLIGKHTVGFKCRFTYVNPDDTGEQISEIKDHTFDADRIAEVTGTPQIAYTSDGYFAVSAVADEDAKEMFVTVGATSGISAPTTGAYDGYINDRVGSAETTKTVGIGAMGWAKVVAADSCGGLGPVAIGSRERFDPRIPAWEFDVSQPDSTGLLEVTVHDSLLAVSAVEFAAKDTGGDYSTSWSTAWDDSSGTIGASTRLWFQEALPLIGKHNVGIKARVQWVDHGGETQTEIRSHSFDQDRTANLKSMYVAFGAGGGWNHRLMGLGDEDCADMFFTYSLSTDPADPSTSAYNATIAGNEGEVSFSLTAKLGDILYLKGRGVNSSTALGPVITRRFLRGDAILTPYFAYSDPTQVGSVGKFDVTIQDPTKTISALEFQKKVGNQNWGGSWLTTWDRTAGTPMVSTTLTRGEDVALAKLHNSAVKMRISYRDENGNTVYAYITETFDADLIPEMLGPPAIAFTSSGVITASLAADEDSTQMFIRAGTSSGITAPTTASYSAMVSDRVGVAISTEFCPYGATSWVKAAASASSGGLGPVWEASRLRTDTQIVSATLTFSSDGDLIVAADAGIEAANIYGTAGVDAIPSDPTNSVYDFTIAGHTGVVTTNSSYEIGETAFVKLRAYDAGTNAGQVFGPTKARRGVGQHEKRVWRISRNAISGDYPGYPGWADDGGNLIPTTSSQCYGSGPLPIPLGATLTGLEVYWKRAGAQTMIFGIADGPLSTVATANLGNVSNGGGAGSWVTSTGNFSLVSSGDEIAYLQTTPVSTTLTGTRFSKVTYIYEADDIDQS